MNAQVGERPRGPGLAGAGRGAATAGLVLWRPGRWTAGVALALGIGAFATPNTAENLGSSSAFLVTTTVITLVTLVAVIATSAVAVLRPGAALRPA
ncbi:hypothetical protein [Streptomyces sp. NPDC055749]